MFLRIFKPTFTRTRFAIETVSLPGNRIENGMVSKSLHGTYPTVYVKAISFSGLCASSVGSRFHQTRVRRLSSPRPNAESLFGFSLCYSAGILMKHFKKSLPVIAVWPSVCSKIHESSKSEVKPQIKVVIVQQSAALRARFTIFTSRASQFRARPFLTQCGFAFYTTSKPYRFENASLLKAYSKRPGSDNELDQRHVNEMRNRIETDAVTNETVPM